MRSAPVYVSNIKIKQNPATSVLNFLGLKISDRWVILDINDISEKRISSVNVENQTEIQMVITALAPGVYFVCFEIDWRKRGREDYKTIDLVILNFEDFNGEACGNKWRISIGTRLLIMPSHKGFYRCKLR